MQKNIQINPDHYDKKVPENLKFNYNNKQLLNPVYDNPHPDYFISRELKQHILSDPKINVSQNIKILDSNLHINTFLNILKLQLSFIINHKLLDPKSKSEQNYKFDVDINLVNYRQEEGVIENMDQELFTSIKKIAQMIYDHVPANKLFRISDSELSHSILELIHDDGNQFLNYITAIISIINVKGKYQKAELKTGGYEKKSIHQKNHIPLFKIEKQDVKITLKIQDPLILIRNDEKILPRQDNSFYQFFKKIFALITLDYNNFKIQDNNPNQGAFNNDPLSFSMKRQFSGMTQGNHSILTTQNLTISLSVIFVLVTILILLISMIV
ncbi:hypothetical protein JXQ31_03975 [candidate division KSB1 bacterium]|nr:hypothetical protein [candidate division KSB1 bacterium]